MLLFGFLVNFYASIAAFGLCKDNVFVNYSMVTYWLFTESNVIIDCCYHKIIP